MPARPRRSLVLGVAVVVGLGCSSGEVGNASDDAAATDGGDDDMGRADGGGPDGDTAIADSSHADAGRLDASKDGAPDGTGDSAALDARPDAPPIDSGPVSARQQARPLGSTTAPNGFYEYLPPSYDDGTPHPLLVFWHGIGEDGNGTSELPKVISGNGPPYLISKDSWPASRPFIVLSPQNPGTGCPSSTEIHDFITWGIGNYHVDPRQVFLTGLSCGAIGSWQYLDDHHAEQVAAAVLMSGDPGDPTASWSAWGKSGCALGEVAIWALHGDADTTVKIDDERTTMTDLLACPSPPRRETRWTPIAGGGHGPWNPIYDLSAGYAIYDFLLANPHP